jgi:hypothetical protein
LTFQKVGMDEIRLERILSYLPKYAFACSRKFLSKKEFLRQLVEIVLEDLDVDSNPQSFTLEEFDHFCGKKLQELYFKHFI